MNYHMKHNKTDYAQKLQDPRWQRKRLEVMQAAGWKCVICGDEKEELNVHHPAYDSSLEPWQYNNLQCLCKTCHTIQHLPKDKMKIHAKSLVTKTIWITHKAEFLSSLDLLMRSMSRNGEKYVSQLEAIKQLAFDEYDNLQAKTRDRVEDFFKKFNEEKGDS